MVQVQQCRFRDRRDGSGVVSDDLTPGWRHLAIVMSGDPVLLDGFDVWKYRWRSLEGEPIVVAHPAYPQQRHAMWRYELQSPRPAVFAAGEYSNSVWGFYVPTPPA